jgi:vacuolar-type H+-ATPase subunit C/Vma6
LDPQDDGNARIRALKAELLRMQDYDALLGRDLPGVLAALAGTAYAGEVRAALARTSGVAALHRAVRERLAGRLRALPRIFRDGARRAVSLLLHEVDLRNVLTVLRGAAGRRPPEDIEPLLVPAGRLDAPALSELARLPDVRALAEHLATEGIPSRAAGRAALEAAGARAGAQAVESALLRAHARSVAAALLAAPPSFHPVARALRADRDARNAVLALRRRAARRRGELVAEADGPFLPGGTLGQGALAAASNRDARGEAAALLVPRPVPPGWGEALQAWVKDGELGALERALDRALRRDAMRGFLTDDPASLDVPVAWAAAVQAEADNLRRIGAGASLAEAADVVRADLLLPPRREV